MAVCSNCKEPVSDWYKACTNCGTALGAATMAADPIESIAQSLRTIKFVVVSWAVLTVVGAVAWIIVRAA